MITQEASVEQAAKKLLPWLVAQNMTRSGMPTHFKRPVKGALQAALGGGIHLVPLISDQRFVSIFDRSIKALPYPEGREFAAELLLSVKRLLSTPEYKRATTRLVKNVVAQQFDMMGKRKAFIEKHGFLPPSLIVMSPSMTCNLRCYGCYAGEYSKADDLPREVIDRVIKEIRGMGINFITVSGGEPFFSQDVLEMWEDNPDIFFLVYTNGTLIDEAMAAKLAKMGNVYPCISVEGYEAETDQRRGKGTYARVMAAMDNLHHAGVIFGFSATAVRGNNDMISSPEFVDYYVKKGCVMGWYFNYMPIGRAPDLTLMPTPEQRVARWRRLKELRRTKPIALADFWCDGSLIGGCIAGGRLYLHINNKGDVEPCVFAHFAADNIKNKTLTEILGSPFFRAIRSRQPYSQNLLRPCMIIDNPEVLRQVVAEGGAKPTHLGADTITGQLAPNIDSYASAYAKVADQAWQEDHAEPARRV